VAAAALMTEGAQWAGQPIKLETEFIIKERMVQSLSSWDDALSANAVEVYVSRLRAKFEPAGLRIRTVRGYGYMLEGEDAR